MCCACGARVASVIYVHARSLGKPSATKVVRHRVSQTLIWITKTARGIPLSDSDLLYVFSLSLFLYFSFTFSFLRVSRDPLYLLSTVTTYQSTYSARFMCHLWHFGLMPLLREQIVRARGVLADICECAPPVIKHCFNLQLITLSKYMIRYARWLH